MRVRFCPIAVVEQQVGDRDRRADRGDLNGDDDDLVSTSLR